MGMGRNLGADREDQGIAGMGLGHGFVPSIYNKVQAR